MYSFANMAAGSPLQINASFDVINPSTLQPAGSAPLASVSDLERAVAAAKAAFPAWSALTDGQRQAYCHQIADKLEAHHEELAAILTSEQGKPMGGTGSMFEIGGAIAWARYNASLEVPVEVLQDDDNGRIEMHRKPIGVVGSITPWNWPVMIAIWHIIPAIRTGNTVVNKPSPFTPLATLRMIELMNEVLPAGVVNSITGDNDIGAAISSHADIGKIVFTGSTPTGQKIMSSAAEGLKRLTLELGGNDAGIVLPDCDAKAIAAGLFWGAFINNGQTCAALKRLYVHDSIYDAVCEELTAFAASVKVGDGFAEGMELGPIQNRMQFDKVNQLVRGSIEAGGKVLCGGPVDDANTLFFPITLIATSSATDPLIHQEQFGPALPIIRYSDIDEVIRQANDNPNGLGGSVWTNDVEQFRAIASQLECGSVWRNKHGAIQPNAPFGGVKCSGVGVEFGQEGLLANTNIQVVYL
ncbi:aldehyde dehydrogenase family protein [Oceanobacter mangrovi]|uniref:aldehyde dehydrogenase family protein n=1 Tax=Oceanobacter mangrovi TaxID=2862510 RepID=UPI001FE749F8|nr:aldehyde dehydrogenase family protein [Oceanobacter mangrovi]